MKFFVEYLKKIWKVPVFFLFCASIMAVVFALYDLPVEPVVYGTILCMAAGIVLFFYELGKYTRRKKSLEYLKDALFLNLKEFPEPADENEKIYQELLDRINEKRMQAEAGKQRFYGELTDYYSLWVHQIKTPIAALRLLLLENGEEQKDALGELFKIEQYVEMVLGYLRTEDMASDMNFRECSLDKIIREQIHKYARIFITKKISLEYEGTETKVLTDSKWLGFVLGQVLSNSLKYTKEGKISIYMCPDRADTLVIQDTGIGIRKEDQPRIFQKGFTGCNGRKESSSTGIGLYLCAKIMKKLGHQISVESEPGKGTRILLKLGREQLELY